MASVAPISLFHKTTAPTAVSGFTFPAGSVFLANQAFIMNDGRYFDNPDIFNPARHIGTDGK